IRSAAITTAAGLATLSILTSIQLRVWRDSTTLFARCVELSTDDKLTDDALFRWANFHSFRGNVPAAMGVLARADRSGAGAGVRAQMEANLAQAADEFRLGAPPLVARIHQGIAIRLAREGRSRE